MMKENLNYSLLVDAMKEILIDPNRSDGKVAVGGIGNLAHWGPLAVNEIHYVACECCHQCGSGNLADHMYGVVSSILYKSGLLIWLA